MTLAYRAEWTHPFIEAERTVGEGERAGTEFQTKKIASATFSISKRSLSACLVQTFSHTKRLLCEALAACNLSGLKATGTDIHLFALSVNNDGNALDIWLKCAGHRAMRVRDRTTSNSVFTAEITNL